MGFNMEPLKKTKTAKKVNGKSLAHGTSVLVLHHVGAPIGNGGMENKHTGTIPALAYPTQGPRCVDGVLLGVIPQSDAQKHFSRGMVRWAVGMTMALRHFRRHMCPNQPKRGAPPGGTA